MNSKKKIIIIDDDAKASSLLQDMIMDYPDFVVKAAVGTAALGLERVKEYKPEILFLDIELPDALGVNLIEKVKEISPDTYIIMFTGVYDEYSSDAFTRKENDYLLKPIDPKELDKAIQRSRYYFMNKTAQTLSPEIPVSELEMKNGDRLAVATYTSEMRVLKIREIGYFRYSTRRKIWEVALNDNSFVPLKRGTKAGDILNYNDKFVQTHQSFIVNIESIMLIGQNNISLYPPFNNDEVLVGRKYRKGLQDRFVCI